MNRRQFHLALLATAVSAALPHEGGAQTASLLIEDAPLAPLVPADFTGLSYESAQLANPDFFSASNQALIALFRGLTTNGNLRLGGGSSEFTTYSDAHPSGPPPFEVFGPDTSKTVKSGTMTTALALRNLRGFLDSTGWSCLYGLNLGQGSLENAVAESAAVARILGPRLLALQLGNEPDSFRNRYRPAGYGPEDFLREWNRFHQAIAAAVPGVRFAGPDISNKLAYLTAFAAEAPRHPDVMLLTGHFYGMGPAGAPSSTLDQLLNPDPQTTTIHLHNVPTIQAAVSEAHLPFRMSEGNSCWDGGKPGVSDTLASALWCADTSLRFAGYGWAGVNWHGGGNGFYTPIAGSPSAGFTRRPEYFGIQFAQAALAGGVRVLPAELQGADPRLTAYALATGKRRRIALVNKTTSTASISLPARPRGPAVELSGPSLDSRGGTVFHPTRLGSGRTLEVPAHTALLFEV